MSRADDIRLAMLWEQVARAARDRAAVHRQGLADQAAAEVAAGVVPTWRLPDLATVTLPVSREAPIVTDPAALAAWCERHHPTEVETLRQVRASYLPALLSALECDGDVVCDPDTGEVIPGLGVRPGGQVGALSIRPAAGVRDVLAREVGGLVDALAATLGETPGTDEVPGEH